VGEHREQYLKPLLDGTIRSAFAMTEPRVASSDATNIELSMVRDGGDYLLNGRKWFASNAMHKNCKVLIVMGKTDPAAAPHRQQSMMVVPMRNTTMGTRLFSAKPPRNPHRKNSVTISTPFLIRPDMADLQVSCVQLDSSSASLIKRSSWPRSTFRLPGSPAGFAV